MTTVSFDELTPRLPVTDLGRTLAFYRDRLGFRPEVLWPEGEPTFAIVARDDARVGFFTSPAASGGQARAPELYVRVSDAAALHARLRDAGVAVEWGPEVYSYGCREFAVRDPDGYLVVFTEPTDDPPTTEEPA